MPRVIQLVCGKPKTSDSSALLLASLHSQDSAWSLTFISAAAPLFPGAGPKWRVKRRGDQ